MQKGLTTLLVANNYILLIGSITTLEATSEAQKLKFSGVKKKCLGIRAIMITLD